MPAGLRKFRTRLRVFGQLGEARLAGHELFTHASAISFRVLVALIPLTLLGLGLLGAFGLEDVSREQVEPALRSRFTPPLFRGIDYSVERILTHASAGLIVFASVLAIWHVSASVRVCMRALNSIYEGSETRPAWRRLLLSIGLAICISFAVIGSISWSRSARS
jgi:membrane protein